MRFSVLLAAAGAALVVASPVHQKFHKKDIVLDIVTDIEWVTITEGAVSTPPAVKVETVWTSTTVLWVDPAATTSSSVPPPPPPAPTTTSTPEPAPAPTTTSTPEPAPVPATSEALAPAATSEAVVQQPTTVESAASAPTDLQSAAVLAHNQHRANHSAPDVAWSDSLAAAALVVANTCVFQHDMGVNGLVYGQNLAAYGTSSSDFSTLSQTSLIEWAIHESWYAGEIANVPWGQSSPSISGPEFLHVTQLIWKASTEIGCAVVNCPANTIFPTTDPNNPEPAWYMVCNYSPTGNVLGEFDTQLSESIGLPAVSATIS